MPPTWLVSSTSPSGGNQVTVYRLLRVLTLEIMFLMKISSLSGRRSDMIVLHNVLKILIELIKWRNNNAREKFYGLVVSKSFVFFCRNFENFEKSRKFENLSGEALLLYEFFEREPGWRLTTRCHTATNWPRQAPANIRKFCRRVCVSVNFYIMVTSFALFNFEHIILKFNFLWISFRARSNLINNWSVGFPK